MNGPYDYIEVDNTNRVRISSPKDRGILNNTYKIIFKLITSSPIHVGSGRSKLKDSKIIMEFSRSKKTLVIPGASLKGAISTNYLVLSGSGNKTSELFGTTSESAYISKVFVDDLKILNKKLGLRIVGKAFPPRKKMRGVKYYPQGTITKSKYLLEVLKENTELFGKIIGYQLSELEVGGLIASLGVIFNNKRLEKWNFKMGYGKWYLLGGSKKTFGLVRLKQIAVYKLNVGFSNKYEKIDKLKWTKFVSKFYNMERENLYETVLDVAKRYFIKQEDIQNEQY